jgi:hypothetical protein
VSHRLSTAPATILAALTLAATSLSGAHHRRIAEFAWRQCDQDHPRVCIRAAARKHRQSVGEAMSVALCENRNLNPLARNPTSIAGEHASGLLQLIPSTFDDGPRRYTRHRHAIWSARWNPMVAFWLWAHGRKGEWSCV